MSDYNKSTPTWLKAQGTFVNGKATVTRNQAVLHSIIIGTYTPGASFRIANGTATNIVNYISGSFTPQGTAIHPPLEFKELEFLNGIYIETVGVLGLTVIYNDLI